MRPDSASYDPKIAAGQIQNPRRARLANRRATWASTMRSSRITDSAASASSGEDGRRDDVAASLIRSCQSRQAVLYSGAVVILNGDACPCACCPGPTVAEGLCNGSAARLQPHPSFAPWDDVVNVPLQSAEPSSCQAGTVVHCRLNASGVHPSISSVRWIPFASNSAQGVVYEWSLCDVSR